MAGDVPVEPQVQAGRAGQGNDADGYPGGGVGGAAFAARFARERGRSQAMRLPSVSILSWTGRCPSITSGAAAIRAARFHRAAS